MKNRTSVLLAGAFALALAGAAAAQTVRVGLINTYSGPLASNGDQIEKAINLFMKSGQCKLPPGVNIEIIKRDDTGINPETAKRLAQELIVRDKVQILTGVVWTPNALAIAPLATEAKVPFVIMNAGTAMITTTSPYIARTSFTVATIVARTSGMTRTSRSGIPISPRRVARNFRLASCVRPESTSLPMMSRQAVGLVMAVPPARQDSRRPRPAANQAAGRRSAMSYSASPFSER